MWPGRCSSCAGMGRDRTSESSSETTGPCSLTGPRVMVVWRPSVARMVYLHTGTMGVHRACLLSFEGASRHPRGPDLAGKLLPCPTHPTYACAPTGGRKAIFPPTGHFRGGSV